jgi:hypothetical protein
MREALNAMVKWVKPLCFSMLLAAVAVIASCTSVQPSATVCGGISSEVGGCTVRHKFIASTCENLASEWARVLDLAVVAVLDGPDSVAEQGRSVRLRQVLVITTADMNTRLQELDLKADCDLPEFIAVAEPLFSAKLRAGVGGALFDGNPAATYEDWLDDVRKVARVIDDGE